MNNIDRFSSTSEESLPIRESVDSNFTMSEDRDTTPSSAPSIDHHYHPDSTTSTCELEEQSFPEDDTTDSFDFLELSDEPPTNEQLAEAGSIPIYDADGNARPFRSLYQGPEHQGQRQLLIFIRHFYCGACQSYVQKLCETITPSAYFSLPIPTTITIIGCGAPHLIPTYGTRTHCPFRMYTEPTRQVYKLFGMRRTIKGGPQPEYMEDGATKLIAKSIGQMIKAGRKDGLCGGPVTQIGGEFLFEDGEPIWSHRMKNVRGHADFKTLTRVLGLTDSGVSTIAGTPEKTSRASRRPRAVERSTHVESEKPKGMRMIYDKSRESSIPRARLARDSRDISGWN